MRHLLPTLLRLASWPEWRLHPWRQGVALLAVALGVALAYSVQLINNSALGEFGAAVRSVNGEPDLAIRGAQGQAIDEQLLARVAAHPAVAVASPVVEVSTTAPAIAKETADSPRLSLRVLGVDAFSVAVLAPALLPQPAAGSDRFAVVDPGAVFVNAALRARLGGGARTLTLQAGDRLVILPIAGSVAAGGGPLAVMDIAGAQATFGLLGRVSRIDVRLAAGANADAVWRELALPPALRAAQAAEADERVARLSRAYRVNLTVLSLVALFTGAFLVFSVQALSVARRVPQFALLGVLGLTAGERRRLVLAEAALLGLGGSALGLALGAGLAAGALRWLGGDLGGGYFPGLAPTLQLGAGTALLYGALGTAAAVVGAWLPARQAASLVPAQALKGLGADSGRGNPAMRWAGPALLVLALGLSLLPPWGELPIAAYLAVACGLVGGIASVPAAVDLMLRWWPRPRHPLALLAFERARRQRQQASVAVAGVVAALSLGVALTVMVSSFRLAVDDWLQRLLPADLYLRGAAGPSSVGEFAFLPAALPEAAARVPGVARVAGQRTLALSLDPSRPTVTLIARPLADDALELPLTGPLHRTDAPTVPGVFASEAMAALYGATPGRTLQLPLGPDGAMVTVFVRALWRDYARQHGAVVMDLAAYQRLSGDARLTDLALWLAPGADLGAVQAALRAAVADPALLEMAPTAEIRRLSLDLFDRSFAVTRYLQAVAIAIGLFGVAASFSAQVLARRKEFGTLAHLGVTRRELLALVAGEGALWTAAGALLGLALGLGVAVVLVHVINPQSFHWTMEMHVPVMRLAWLCAAVLAAGTLTAAIAGRAAADRRLALAVKEDW